MEGDLTCGTQCQDLKTVFIIVAARVLDGPAIRISIQAANLGHAEVVETIASQAVNMTPSMWSHVTDERFFMPVYKIFLLDLNGFEGSAPTPTCGGPNFLTHKPCR